MSVVTPWHTEQDCLDVCCDTLTHRTGSPNQWATGWTLPPVLWLWTQLLLSSQLINLHIVSITNILVKLLQFNNNKRVDGATSWYGLRQIDRWWNASLCWKVLLFAIGWAVGNTDGKCKLRRRKGNQVRSLYCTLANIVMSRVQSGATTPLDTVTSSFKVVIFWSCSFFYNVWHGIPLNWTSWLIMSRNSVSDSNHIWLVI